MTKRRAKAPAEATADRLCGATVPGPLSDEFAAEGGVACLRRRGHSPPCIGMMCDAEAADARSALVLSGAWPDVCLSTKAEAMLPSAKTLMQALTQSGAEIARLEAEVSVLRGQLSVAERELKASKDGAQALKAELDRLRARAAAPPPAPAQAPVPAAPPATRFSLLKVD